MAEYKRGQRLRVTLDLVVEDQASGLPGNTITGLRAVGGTGDGPNYHAIDLNAPFAKVEILDPANWPPQVGDIWEAGGREYFARLSGQQSIWLIVSDCHAAAMADNQPDYYENVPGSLDAFKALNPVLARRRGQ